MKKKLQKWLLLFFLISFCATSALTYVAQTKLAERTAVLTIKTRINYLRYQIEAHEKSVLSLSKKIKEILKEKAANLALNLKSNPELAKDETFLNTWKSNNDLEEIQIFFPDSPKPIPDIKIPSNQKKKSAGETVFLTEAPCENKDSQKLSAYAPWGSDNRLIRVSFSCNKYQDFMEDLSIEHLSANLKLDNYGRGSMMIARNGKLISDGNLALTKQDLHDSGVLRKMYKDDEFHRIWNKKSGTYHAQIHGKKVFFYFEPYKNYMFLGIYFEKDLYRNRNKVLLFNITFLLILFLVVYVLMAVVLDRMVISGIKKINDSLKKITNGDLNEKVSVTTNDEFISLSDSINSMVDGLQQAHQESLQRINHELQLAYKIQTSQQPAVFPAFPDQNKIDLFALSRPAKEVSGDFYDFFMLDGDPSRLAFTIADVSEKGIPAALFVMTTRALLKNLTNMGYSPAEIFNRINRQLKEDNKINMFVTAFMGILNIDTGKLVYVNAGHMPPYICRHNGKFQQLEVDPEFVLGAIDHDYQQHEIQLNYNDTLFLYTDGITEAEDRNQTLFSQERLEKLINENPADSVQDTIFKIKSAVEEYEKGCEQSDDFTMLALRYLKNRLYLPARMDKIDEAMTFVESMLQNHSSAHTYDVLIAVEEIFSNIAKYAYPDRTEGGFVDISCAIGGDPVFISVTFTDSGIPFNPLDRPDPDITLPLMQREPGKMGLFMVKKMMDSVTYTYQNAQNVLTIRKQL